MTPISALGAARRFAAEHGLPPDDLAVLKDGSNLLVHLAPAPVVLRISTFTAAIRGDPLPYLEREVALVSYLAGVGAAVMPPSDIVDPGPHVVGGWAMSAWRHVEHEVGVVIDPRTALRALDELHAALRGYPGDLPLLSPAVDDLDLAIAFAVERGVFSAARASDVQARRDELVETLLAVMPATQAQHGDAFARNSLMTRSGVVWIDFEDCCEGPVLWDLATLVRQPPDPAIKQIVERRYGVEPLETAIALRQVQVDVWMALHDARTGLGL